jgi:hypothetical protein
MTTRETIVGCFPGADWTTAQAIADVTDLKVRTVMNILRKLINDGVVEAGDQPRGEAKLYRLAQTLAPADQPSQLPPLADDSDTDALNNPPEDDEDGAVGDAGTMPREVGARVYEAPGGTPSEPLSAPAGDDVDSVAAFMASNRPTPEAAPVSEPKTGTCTHPGCGIAIVKDGRSWTAADPADAAREAGHKHTTKTQREPKAPREPGQASAASNGKTWAKGELASTVLAFLQKAPGESFGATAVAKALGAQTGSTAFALDKHVSTGHAKLTQDKPRRYAAA